MPQHRRSDRKTLSVFVLCGRKQFGVGHVCDSGGRWLYEGMQNDNAVKDYNSPPLSVPFFYGWVVLALCFLTTLTSAGVRSSPSVLIHPLEAEFAWSRAAIASAVGIP